MKNFELKNKEMYRLTLCVLYVCLRALESLDPIGRIFSMMESHVRSSGLLMAPQNHNHRIIKVGKDI